MLHSRLMASVVPKTVMMCVVNNSGEIELDKTVCETEAAVEAFLEKANALPDTTFSSYLGPCKKDIM